MQATNDSTSVNRHNLAVGYLAMLAGSVGLFFLIRLQGEALIAPLSPGRTLNTVQARSTADTLLHVLLALVAVIVLSRAVGWIFSWLRQPAVVGEVLAGIIIGPSVVGRLMPDVAAFVLPAGITPIISVISQIGVILYMFLVGLSLNGQMLKQRPHASVAVSHASIVTPFLLGCALALWLYPRFSSRDVPFTVFALFIGVSTSVTAFPVLARILDDTGLKNSRMGTIALACAAVDDITAWCLLAFVVSVVQSRPGRVLLTVGLTALFVGTMLMVVRPVILRLVRWHSGQRRLSQGTFAVVFVALFLSALTTELIGIHALFGAFLLGALVPHDSRLAAELTNRLEDLVVVAFLPAFFALTGMRTQIGLVQGASEWLLCAVIIVVASLGKFGGSSIAARVTGLEWRQAVGLGVLMNTRGLMELIVLNVGLELKILSPTLFTMLVLMALVTTMATAPVLQSLGLDREAKRRLDQPAQPELVAGS